LKTEKANWIFFHHLLSIYQQIMNKGKRNNIFVLDIFFTLAAHFGGEKD
jgi:hypothetical protein